MELASFYGGRRGESAYQTWLNLGNQGTEEDFINYKAIVYSFGLKSWPSE